MLDFRTRRGSRVRVHKRGTLIKQIEVIFSKRGLKVRFLKRGVTVNECTREELLLEPDCI